MLFPNKTKYRKWQVGRRNPIKPVHRATRGNKLFYGSYGLVADTPARVKSNQIEAARKVVSRTLGKEGQYWIRIFPDRPVTAKAAEVGMGKGKGNPEGFCFETLPGRIVFEVEHANEAIAREALRKAGTKLPMKVKIISGTPIQGGRKRKNK